MVVRPPRGFEVEKLQGFEEWAASFGASLVFSSVLWVLSNVFQWCFRVTQRVVLVVAKVGVLLVTF